MTYLQRKNKELNILNSFLQHPMSFDIQKLNDIVEIKSKIIKNYRFENFQKYYRELTNKDFVKFDDDFKYNYTYERFNGHIVIDDFTKNFYNLECEFDDNFFTNCGMSAIASLLTSMVCYNDIKIDLMYATTYFETIKYLVGITKQNEYSKKALFIDTIAVDFNCNIDKSILKNYDYVIIDTTCFLPKELKVLINQVLFLKIPCFVIRSHTKLDMLATEFSHLGSVCIVMSDYKEDAVKIFKDAKHILGVYGGCIGPEKFPAFLFDREIDELNQTRINCVRENADYLYDYAKQQNINFEMPNHKQFLLYNFENKKLTLEELKVKIINFCKENQNLLVYHAVSFGFDFIALDCYENFQDKQFKIRICLNDMDKEEIKLFADKFIQFLREEC